MGLVLKHYSADGHTEITSKAWPDAFAGVAQTAEKFFVQNVGDRDSTPLELRITQVGATDGSSMMRQALDTATVMPPYGLAYTLTAAGAGGQWGTAQTAYYVLTATNALGQTVASVELSVTIDVATKKVVLTWPKITGATGYKLYRTSTPGTYGASSLRVTIGSGSTLTYTDDGSACSAGAPPSANTTGGAAPTYGTAPTLSTATLNIGILKIGQWAAYWVNRVIPSGTPEAGNPRQSLREFVET
jgi:hypothetical protein